MKKDVFEGAGCHGQPGRFGRSDIAYLRSSMIALTMACSAFLAGCSNDTSLRDEANGETDALKGDWADATRLFETAYAQHPDVINEFNLATAYENNGQDDKATALYEGVLVDGYYTPTHLSTPDGDKAEATPGIFLSDEATKRMAVMASRKALAQSAAVIARQQAFPAEKIMICDFPALVGTRYSRQGRIYIFVDDQKRTATTFGFFAIAANQQEVDSFDVGEVNWTQRYQIVGRTNVYHYHFDRQTGLLDVTRPAPDPSGAAEATATCHPAKGA